MALKHHWKFNNNLQDAIGDLHLTNVVGTPTYTSNKDGVANSCADFDTTWYGYRGTLTENIEENTNYTYSFWLKRTPTADIRSIYTGKIDKFGRTIYTLNTNNLVFGDPANFFIATMSLTNEWNHYVLTINKTNTTLKIFENGILIYLSNSISNSITTMNDKIYIGSSSTGGYIFNKELDEFKIFDTTLTDGGVTTIGQTASLDSEVWQLYLAGVNNIPAYTQNPATDITGTTARLSWNES
jgi:hypothetical protein